MSQILTRVVIATIGGMGLTLLGGCDLHPKQATQTGYRGAGLDQISDITDLAQKQVNAIPPAPYPLPPDGGPTAGQSYQNIKVLGGVSKERFDHLMAEISQWIAPPEQGCTYCHNPANMASDEKYTKVVARRMLQMTQNINSHWSSHVQQVGVTCYTCHRGNAVPQYKWAIASGPANPDSITGNRNGRAMPSVNNGYTTMAPDPFASYLNGPAQIRVAGDTALPSPDHVVSIKNAETTYGLMMHVSTALGVNCSYCHNSQSFRAWNLSRPQRVTAWYGIRMVRDTNVNYIGSLQSVFPAYRKGPNGDPYKVNCTTCHQGLAKPLNGVSMIAQAPALMGPTTAMEPTPAMAPMPAMPPAAAPAAVPVALNAPRAMAGAK